MASNADYFLKKTLGEDFIESLMKFELWKPGTRTTVDHEEIKTALQIVPRTIMSHIIHHLTSMQIGETKETQIPVTEVGAMLRVTKHERDVYSGDILQENKIIVDFKYRSIPGVALVIMSAFELYDTEKLLDPPPSANIAAPVEDKIQKMIEERLALHDLVNKVVDKKLEQREAVHQMFMAKLTEELKADKVKPQDFKDEAQEIVDAGPSYPSAKVVEKAMDHAFAEGVKAAKKVSPLKGFLENKKNKSKPAEFAFEMLKGETVSCPDCGNSLISGHMFTGCVCLGNDMDKKVYIKKSEDGIKVRFGRGWDPENIEMLLELLRRKRG